MNQVSLIGRLTVDPELRYTASNIPFCRFSLAINRTFSGADGNRGTDFIRIIVWRRQAENIAKYIGKGSLVGIVGRLQSSNYEDKDGSKRSSIEVVADNVQFLESKGQARPAAQPNMGPSASNPNPYDYMDDTSVPPVTDVDDVYADLNSEITVTEDDIPDL